jgi:hypothetical protein
LRHRHQWLSRGDQFLRIWIVWIYHLLDEVLLWIEGILICRR